ncbi:MAG: UTP--glucose-1-phosphate uridylyltransferase [Myxococcota bacterium]
MVKGVIVAAGYGSRFLPVTRVVPKELLPIVDRPAIDWVVREMVEAGIEDLLVITSRRKKALDDWFDRDPELEALFGRDRLGLPPIRTSFVRQSEMRGTGHALMLARSFCGDDPFVVAFPDDLFGPPNCSAQLIADHKATGCTVLACGDLTGEDVSRYGVVDAVDVNGVLRVRGMVEKPAPGTEPSHLVSWGRYLYTPEVFDALEAGFRSHTSGEFYATDAIAALAKRERVVASVIPSVRYDTGDRLGYLTTVIDVALGHPELGGPLRAWLDQKLR